MTGNLLINLIKFVETYPDIVVSAVYAEAQIDMTEMKRRCPVAPTASQYRAMGRSVPKKTIRGQLRSTGRVSEPVRKGKTITTILSFGGGAVDYAVAQHERTDWHHTTGQSKYAESVLNESASTIMARLRDRIHLDRLK